MHWRREDLGGMQPNKQDMIETFAKGLAKGCREQSHPLIALRFTARALGPALGLSPAECDQVIALATELFDEDA